LDLLKLADILVDKIGRDYIDDVSVVHIYGSYVSGGAHERSDLDIIFVPKTSRGADLGCSFIINGIGCDFWAIPWERLERIASHEEPIAAIITEGRTIYCASDEDRTRFEELKQRALDTNDPGAWRGRAVKALDSACKDAF